MSVQTRDFLKRRRDRALGTIMGHLERSAAWPKLSDVQRVDVRNCVIESLNSYHDTVLDLVKAEDDVARNDEVLTLLRRIETASRRPAPSLLGLSTDHVEHHDGQLPAEVAR